MNKQLSVIIFLCSFASSYSQIHYSGEVTGEGYYPMGDELPFWMYHNKRGRVSEDTNMAVWVTGKAVYNFGAASFLEVGAGILYRDGIGDNVLLDEAYIQYKNDRLQITGGRKQKEELYNGLSATNENILWSLNARPLPGLQLSINRPVMVFPNAGIGFEASLEEYVMEEDRHVSNARLHHKSFHLVFQPDEVWRIRAGIQHFAQWGGDSKTTGQQPEGFKDYLKIFAGREGGENAVDGDRVNVLGNHLGSYELYISKQFHNFELELIYNHLFEDGSGSRYDNFPDGRYGFFLKRNAERSIINSFMYEFYYTRNQGRFSSGPHKYDHYFDNLLLYNSGWTYKKRIIGVPFFTFSETLSRGVITNNEFIAHHLGFSGNYLPESDLLPFKFIFSYLQYFQRNNQQVPKVKALYIDYTLGVLQRPFRLSLNLSSEINQFSSPVFGAGIQLNKRF